MKQKLERRSYFFGIFMGVMIGVGVGYVIAMRQVIHQFDNNQDAEVTLGIATLRALEKNDVKSVTRLFEQIIACDYLQHSKMDDSSWGLASKRNAILIDRVEKASNELPGLKLAIEKERAKSATPTTSR